MGNYYEGKMIFILRNDIPMDIVNDLYILNTCSKFDENCKKDDSVALKDTRWFKHERFHDPDYYFHQVRDASDKRNYILHITFEMKGCVIDGDDLGQDIYNVLKPYIDETAYDMSNGGYIGRIHDEDDTYDKMFYVNEDILKQEMEKRKYLCNQHCGGYKENCLCDRYAGCSRAYIHGLKDGKEGIVHDGTKLINKLIDFNKTH